jgi:hypothetical protein
VASLAVVSLQTHLFIDLFLVPKNELFLGRLPPVPLPSSSGQLPPRSFQSAVPTKVAVHSLYLAGKLKLPVHFCTVLLVLPS